MDEPPYRVPGPAGPAPAPWPAPPPVGGVAPKARPRAWWFVVGVALLAAAAGVFAVLVVSAVHQFRTEATVAVDSQPHAVTVGTDKERLIWVRDGSAPVCTIVDEATGAEVRHSVVLASYTRSNSSGAYHGEYQIAPGSGRLQVTCRGEGRNILIGPVPGLATFALKLVAGIGALLVLGGLGLVVLIVTGVRFATRPARSG